MCLCCCLGEDGIIESNVVNGEETKKSKSRRKRRSMRRVVTSVEDKGDHILYWIPRIHLLFSAEDPQLFSQRVVQAVQDRRLTEAHLRLESHLLAAQLMQPWPDRYFDQYFLSAVPVIYNTALTPGTICT